MPTPQDPAIAEAARDARNKAKRGGRGSTIVSALGGETGGLKTILGG